MSLQEKFFRNRRPTVLAVFLVSLAAAILFAWVPRMGVAALLAELIALVTGVILVWRGTRAMIRHSIWRLRNRLIVTYIFIGVVPLVLVLALVGIGGYIMAGQTAMYLVSSELDRLLSGLTIPASVLEHSTTDNPMMILERSTEFLKGHFPNLRVTVQRNGQVLHYPAGSKLEMADANAPSYTGITIREGAYQAWSHTRSGDLIVDLVAPIDRELLAGLVPHLGRVDLFGGDVHLARRHRVTADELRNGEIDAVPPPGNQFDYELYWGAPYPIVEWGTGRKLDSHLLLVTTRPSALLNALFGGDRFKVAQALLYVFGGIALLFLLVELVSLIIGVSLTRTITGAINSLYDGTRRVAEGDFSHRIKVKGRDQLAAVSASFNVMTERLEELVIVEKEKERLQSELEIAREVQSQLFPRAMPKMRTLEVTGVCRPARMVSGDYYDFLCLQETNLALAIGDVAGKGISAALLMASIQSIMRTQLSGMAPVLAASANGSPRQVYSTSGMVSQLNRQLYMNTSPEKYATFLFGIYDEHDRTLTYTNAGHLPPILIRNGEATLLEVTGTVVGAFPMSRYEEQKVQLEAGDLLVSYTDGITEPENEYGEEFGADRLVEALIKNQKLPAEEMINRVMDMVRNWTTAEELPDDMTLMLLRRNA